MELHFDSRPADTIARIKELDRYMSAYVLSERGFVCQNFNACRGSHPGEFFEGQLHHIGDHYDLHVEGRPLRIAVMGQEYGNGPAGVDRIARTRDVAIDTGRGKRFRADGRHPARNPHMRGTTNVLRLLLGAGLGSDYEGEFLTLGSKRAHIFEAFALTNFLLCSAIAAGLSDVGSKRGRSTRVMQRNCSVHLRAAMEILEPTVIIVQGRGVRGWPSKLYMRKFLNPLPSNTGLHLSAAGIGGAPVCTGAQWLFFDR